MTEAEYLQIIYEQSRTIEELEHQLELLSAELAQLTNILKETE